MSAMWYYSEGNQQKGPVSWGALSNLARDGNLRPADLIWQEGTPDWVKAGKVPGLFDAAPPRGGADRPSDEPAARRRAPRDDRDDVDDDRPRRPVRRKQGSGKGLMIGLIAGGAGLVIIAVVVIIIIVANSGGGKVGAGGGPKVIVPPHTLNNSLGRTDPRDTKMRNSFCKSFQVELTAGRSYTFYHQAPTFDAFLRLENPTGMEVAWNDDAGDGTLNSRITYRAPTSGVYRVICTSLHADDTGTFTLSIN